MSDGDGNGHRGKTSKWGIKKYLKMGLKVNQVADNMEPYCG